MNVQPETVAKPQPGVSLTGFTPTTATVNSAHIGGRIGPDIEATICYEPTRGFELMWKLVADPTGPPTMIQALSDDDLRALLGEIETALGHPSAGLDTKALEAIGDVIEGVLGVAPDPFAQARFGAAVEEIFGGTMTVIGQLSLGIDVVATIHDTAGVITWEHRPLPMPPGPFRPLTSSERDGLTAALSAWLEGHPDNAWQRILDDLEK